MGGGGLILPQDPEGKGIFDSCRVKCYDNRMSAKTEDNNGKKKKWAWLVLAVIILLGSAVLFIDFLIRGSGRWIITEEEAEGLTDIDCILVLGCSVKKDGTPSAMLEDRILTGVRLYEAGVSGKLLMSGDHGQDDYDEVNTMKDYAVQEGVGPDEIFLDHAGFNTYASMYRARDVFQVKRVVIVTQRYHLYRALYIARKLGLEAYGVPADTRTYSGQFLRDLREIAARCKAFVYCIFMPEPEYLGDPIPIQGNGSSTDG